MQSGTVLAYDENDALTAFAILPPTMLPVSATVAVTASAWRTDFRAIEARASNFGAGIIELEGRYEVWSDGIRSIPTHLISAPGGATSALEFLTIPGTTAEELITLTWRRLDSPDIAEGATIRYSGTSTSVVVDASSPSLPNLAFDGIDRSLVQRPVVRWSTNRAFGDQGLVLAILQTPRGGVFWQAVIPPSGFAFRMPALPDELADLRPDENTNFVVVAFFDFDDFDGFDAAKAIAFAELGQRRRASRFIGYGAGL
jgi:hypothetical protein